MKKLLFPLITIAVLLSLSNTSNACSVAKPTIAIKCDIEDSLFQEEKTCLNNDCTIFIKQNEYDGIDLNLPDREFPIPIYEEWGIQIYEENMDFQESFDIFDPICVENLDKLKPIINQEIEKWLPTRENYFTNGNLVFEPYTEEREAQLIKAEKDLDECSYEKYEIINFNNKN